MPAYKSTNVRSSSYDKSKKELTVNFGRRGEAVRTYVYEEVKPAFVKRLETAPSKGRFMNRYGETHPHVRVK